jgi:beta-phosphoglucomutase
MSMDRPELKLVIFDMDGVLVDACEWHKDAFNFALKEICNYEINDEDHHLIFNGLPTKNKLQKLSDMGAIDPSDHDKINKVKQEKTIDIIFQKSKYEKEKVELFKWLKGKGIKVACFTNSIKKTATLILEKAGIFSELDMFLTNQDVANPKPNPEGYLKVLNDLNVNSQNAMIVEDSPKGYEAAIASGCKVMRVENAKQVNIGNLRRFIDESFNSNGGRGK